MVVLTIIFVVFASIVLGIMLLHDSNISYSNWKDFLPFNLQKSKSFSLDDEIYKTVINTLLKSHIELVFPNTTGTICVKNVSQNPIRIEIEIDSHIDDKITKSYLIELLKKMHSLGVSCSLRCLTLGRLDNIYPEVKE